MACAGEEEFSAILPWSSKFAKDRRYEFEALRWLDFEKLDDFLFNEEDDDEWFCKSDCRHGKTVFKSDEVLKSGMDVTNQQKSLPSRRSAGSIHLPKRTIATPLNDNTQRFLNKNPVLRTSATSLKSKDKNNENAISSSKLPGVNKNKSQVRNSKHDLYSENQHPNRPNSISPALKAKRKPMPRSSSTMKDAVKLRQNVNSSDGDKVIQLIGSNPDHQHALQNHKIHADQLDAPQNQKIHAGQDPQVVLATTKVSEIEEVEVSKMGKFESYHPDHEKGESGQNPQRFRDLLGLDIDQAETDEEIPMKKRITKAPAATYDFQKARFGSGLTQSSSTGCLWDKMTSNRRVKKVSSFCSNMLPFHVQKVQCKFTSNEAKPKEELKLGDMIKHEMPEKQEHETANIEHGSAQAFLHGCSATLENLRSYKKSKSVYMFKIAKWKKQNNHEKEQRDGDEGEEHSQSNLPTCKKFKLTNIFKPNKWAK